MTLYMMSAHNPNTLTPSKPSTGDHKRHASAFLYLLYRLPASYPRHCIPCSNHCYVRIRCQYVRSLELEGYQGRRGMAEFLYMTLYGIVCILILSYLQLLGMPSISLLSMFIYVWSRREPHAQIDIYGFTFQRWHLPLVMVFLQMLFKVAFDPVWAVLIGHGWVVLTTVVPRVYRKTVVTVPEWWYEGVDKMLDMGSAALGGRPAAAQTTTAAAAGGAGGVGGGAGGAAAGGAGQGRPTWMRGPGHRLDG